MFIVWGKTIKRQKLGFVADYCGVCRDVRGFLVKRIGSASHVYYISFGEGDLVGYERICQQCSTAFEAVPDTYSGMAKESRPGSELIPETFPNYYAVYRELIERERKVRDTPSLLTSGERRARLREPFGIVAQVVQQKLASVQVDGRVWIAVAAFFPLLWVLGALGGVFIDPDNENAMVRWMLACSAVSLALVIWQLMGSARRYVLKHAVPPLVNALAPLRPAEEEITDILQELKQRKFKLGSKLEAADITQAIELKRNQI